MSEINYTPNTQEVRHAFGEAFVGDGSMFDIEEVSKENRAQFDRWLAAHNSQVAADALESVTVPTEPEQPEGEKR